METQPRVTASQVSSFALGDVEEQRLVAQFASAITPDHQVKQAVDSGLDVLVTLVRGASVASGEKAVKQKSAGGVTPDAGCGRPTEANVVSQVGGSQPGKPQEKLPEFTAAPQNSVKWARRGGWLVVAISAKYLVRGDVGQQGWTCLHAAPLANAHFFPHPKPTSTSLPNAD